jgi:indolepyruvate ferredoxin oxidoreductase alpha subunit
MLEPAGPAEAKEMTKQAFELSEELGVPVLLRTTTRVSHAREAVSFGNCKKPQTQTTFKKAPFDLVVVPAVARKKHLELLGVYDNAVEVSEKSGFNARPARASWASSPPARPLLMSATPLMIWGLKIQSRCLPWDSAGPCPRKSWPASSRGWTRCLIVEELEPLVESAVKALAHDKGIEVKIKGKSKKHPEVTTDVAAPTEFTRAYEYSPRQVRGVIAKFAGVKYKAKKPVKTDDISNLPGRPPNLCSGCPHRATYYAVKEVLGQDAVYPTDIGCYTLGLLPPFSMADFLVCMGSSASGAGGIAKATGQKVVSFIGDSTFFHSGLTGLVNAVHNNHNFTLVILDNGTTAMTGHQPHPGVDTEAIGDVTSHVDIEMVVRGLGVQKT